MILIISKESICQREQYSGKFDVFLNNKGFWHDFQNNMVDYPTFIYSVFKTNKKYICLKINALLYVF